MILESGTAVKMPLPRMRSPVEHVCVLSFVADILTGNDLCPSGYSGLQRQPLEQAAGLSDLDAPM